MRPGHHPVAVRGLARPTVLALLAGLALLLVLPALLSASMLNAAIQMLIAALFACAFNLLCGQGGMLSFGHSAYFGVGVFATVHAMNGLAGQGLLPTPLLPVVGALVGDVVHRGEARNDAAKIERRRDHQQPVRPGEALELDAERTPHRAAGAVGANEIAAGAPLARSIALDRDFDAGGVLADAGNSRVELQLEIGMAAHLVVQNARELRLFALQSVGMLCHVGDACEIELRQQPVPLGAILKRRRLQSLRDQRPGRAEHVQHVERRRMEGRGARFFAQARPFLEHCDRNAGAREVSRGDEADRPRAGDEDPLLAQLILLK